MLVQILELEERLDTASEREEKTRLTLLQEETTKEWIIFDNTITFYNSIFLYHGQMPIGTTYALKSLCNFFTLFFFSSLF